MKFISILYLYFVRRIRKYYFTKSDETVISARWSYWYIDYILRNVSHLKKILREDERVIFDILLASYSCSRDS